MKLKDISSQFPPPSPTHPVGFFSGLLRTVRSNIGSPVFRKGRRKSEINQNFLSFPSPFQFLAGSIFLYVLIPREVVVYWKRFKVFRFGCGEIKSVPTLL